MSNTLIESASAIAAGKAKASPAIHVSQILRKASASPWAWLAITCVLLSISGGIRTLRDMQFSNLARGSKTCPFRLDDIPTKLGSWRVVEGSQAQLDPETAKTAGSSDHFIRAYTDTTTGTTASILVLYGLADSVFSHGPDACYPASGYQVAAEPVNRELSISDSAPPARYRISYFAKAVAGIPQYKEVISTFRHDGTWLPDIASRWKMFRYHPGMFKIQIEHTTSGPASDDSPIVPLLDEVIREIEKRVAEGSSPGAERGKTS
jgi:hypothetical protein